MATRSVSRRGSPSPIPEPGTPISEPRDRACAIAVAETARVLGVALQIEVSRGRIETASPVCAGRPQTASGA